MTDLQLSRAPRPGAVQITVRYPDWITCQQWLAGVGPCATLNVVDEVIPIQCVRCGRAL